MAYAAVLSLKRTIDLYSSDISLVPGEILDSLYKGVESLEKIAKRVFESSPSRPFEEIKDAAEKLEEAIVSHSIGRIVSRSKSCGDEIQFFKDLQDLKQDIDSFTKRVKMMEAKLEEYADELYSLPEEEEEEDDDAISSRIDSGGEHKPKMIGLSNEYAKLKGQLIGARSLLTSIKYFVLVGMPGIGKTTLAKKIFEDPEIVENFDCRVWVTVGRKCQLKDIPRRILAQVNPKSDQKLAELRDEDIAQCLEESLKGKRYLIILDDVWDRHIWHHLETSSLYKDFKSHFPDETNRSRVLLTTRRQQVDKRTCRFSNEVLTMRLLNKEESWDLLREKVFGKESCPSQLGATGKKIAENCQGLPLMIVMVADLLSKVERNEEQWNEVTIDKQNSLFMDAYDEISKVLLPSYKYLPRLLQMCFLYMGLFPQNYEIPQSKLINMWKVDGFLELKNANKFSYDDAIKYLEELVSNSLVMIHQTTLDHTRYAFDESRIKTCGLHSSFWHLCNREARRNKFSLVLNSHNDDLGEGMKGQRRLSFHNNVLFGIKDVNSSVEDNCKFSTHSLLCYGPYHQYQVPVCFGLRLLKQLDALTIRFYEFPIEVLRLVHLRYLTLTVDGKLPTSISQLSNLQFLIVGRYLNIKSCIDPSYLPVEIWDMKELQNLQVTGSDLPKPYGTSLEGLSALSNVSAHSCTEAVLKAIPNLEKLGIRIELAPDDDGNSLSCFGHISHLKKLRSLKCVNVNIEAVPPLALLSNFPSHLTKLSLSGLGYGWEEMSKIASLIFLKVLKLRNFAFRGPKWEVKEHFSLCSLVIEDTDLKVWKIGMYGLQRLKYLSMKHCYKLREIQKTSEMFLERIEVVDCSPFGVDQIKNVLSRKHTKVSVHSSSDDGSSRSSLRRIKRFRRTRNSKPETCSEATIRMN